ncbi:glycoside hydrolase family protein [Desulfobacula sp.]|uniref:glycoside hydrolase family protein n=1 Tax=Desulfobacula sp. TaxID=2593537 RepID=UPI0025B80013|nr:glycoside hydrolase family protein [Desulfobacula sp.]MBC2704245.1 glycoside hydrolase family protein [Desulfobacula sp.]
MNIKKITDQLIAHEGLKLKPYNCPAGKLTIGVGRNLEDKGITEKEAKMLLENDIQECIADLQTIFQAFDLLPEPAQMVLVDMRFNLGYQGFRKFKNMIKAVRDQDFHTAAREMKDSRWYHQVGRRAEHLIEMMQDSADLAGTAS